ncbi:thylakoid ADP,ATP carrier protein, chloroplastic-like [Miscanthus floridulus]|uniref:thylakoid ADP,ATP carrier protein, chloroplastic-like n=1 Tax=Miscanthus floridulus TaxID=154761 RepID=UPI00345A3A64
MVAASTVAATEVEEEAKKEEEEEEDVGLFNLRDRHLVETHARPAGDAKVAKTWGAPHASFAIVAASLADCVADPAMADIAKEGLKGYWKGNLPQLVQVIRIIPYSAVQLFSYEVYEKIFHRKEGQLSLFGSLAAGACTGMTSTCNLPPTGCSPLRLAVQSGHNTLYQVALNMLREEGLASFYGGLGPSLIESVPEKYKNRRETSLATALLSATFTTLMCYPLDTVRSQMQMKGTPHNIVSDAIPGSYASIA